MRRYFFHIIHSDHRVEDLEGAVFTNLRAAQEEAFETLCDLIADAMTEGRPSGLNALEIEDEDEVVVGMVKIDEVVDKVLVTLRGTGAAGNVH
jgi:repressor of nif and glnA expression